MTTTSTGPTGPAEPVPPCGHVPLDNDCVRCWAFARREHRHDREMEGLRRLMEKAQPIIDGDLDWNAKLSVYGNPTTSEDERRTWQSTWDIVLGLVVIVMGIASVTIGLTCAVPNVPLWSFGAGVITVGVMLVQAGRR